MPARRSASEAADSFLFYSVGLIHVFHARPIVEFRRADKCQVSWGSADKYLVGGLTSVRHERRMNQERIAHEKELKKHRVRVESRPFMF